MRCEVYKPCSANLDFIDDGAMSNYEKMCYMIDLFKQNLEGLEGLDEALALKEDITYLTNTRLLSLKGDFTGTWNSETLAQVKAGYQLQIDALELLIDANEQGIVDVNVRVDNERIITDAQVLDLETTKEDSINITNARLLNPSGDFTGTLDGNTIPDLLQAITDANALSQQAIDLVNSNPQLNVVFVDGGFYLDGLTPTVEDFGLYTDPDTISEDYGLYIYPCDCVVI